MPQKLVDFYLSCAGRTTGRSVPVLRESFTRMPSFVGFAMETGVETRTIHNWGDAHPEFREAMDYCNSVAADMVQQFALNNVWSPSMAQFTLKANFGFEDKQIVETTGNVTLHFDDVDKDA
jgi:hypothetical protein